MLAELLRALPVAVVVGTMPGYFWARCLCPARDRAELLAYSTALSIALVPTAALAQTRLLGTGVTLPVAALSVAAVFAGGTAAYLWFGRPGDDEHLPASPPVPWSAYALAPLPLAFGLMLATALGLVSGAWYATGLLVLAAGVAGSFASRGQDPARDEPGSRLRSPVWGALVLTTLLLVLLRGYRGPVRYDWPFIRGGDQYSHAVMSGLMMTEGRIDSYLIYPPGFHTMIAVISRLSGLEPLDIFPVVAPALLVLPALACYALSTRLWGQPYGVVAAFFCGLLLVGPYESFAEARYPNLLSADFLIVTAVGALIRVYSAPGARSGILLAILGSSVVLYHQVGSLYLAVLLALVAIVSLPNLLLAGQRKGATALFLSLALLGLFSVFYAWDTYDLPRLAAGLLGGSDTGAGGTAVAIAIGSQEPLSLEHLLATTSEPVAWLGLLGALLATGEVLRRRIRTPQALACLTFVLWALLLFAGSRTSYSGFPQRFERDLGIPLAVLAALAFVGILRSIHPSGSSLAAILAVLAATLAVAGVGIQGAQNMKNSGKWSPNVVSEEVAAGGEWLGEHNTGGNIVVTPYLNDHVPGSAMLAMGGYTGLRSYTQERLRNPRALPPSGKEPLLAANRITYHPVGERTEALLDRYDIRYVALYKRYPGVPWRAFARAPQAYEKVFENGAVIIFSPRENPLPRD
ncbi:MAG TPA: hypothetical protein VFR69_07290 [Rubrobacteraceae bacterium]|nr:hypothetical protein [Rubrobacteraceae bacterium]